MYQHTADRIETHLKVVLSQFGLLET
jgi:hypothetical protein